MGRYALAGNQQDNHNQQGDKGMITFSKQQLKIPKLQRPVYLVTAGQSKFDRAFPDKRTEELCIDSFTMAARLLDISPAELKSYIHSCYYGHFADHFGDQLLGESVIHDRDRKSVV